MKSLFSLLMRGRIFLLINLALAASCWWWWHAQRPLTPLPPVTQHKDCAPLNTRMSAEEASTLARHLQEKPPRGLIRYIGFRRWRMDAAADGSRRSGVALVAYDEGKFAPAECSDDQGMYWLAPQVMQVTGWSAAKAIPAVLGFFFLLGFSVATVAVMALYPAARARAWAALFLLGMAAATLWFGDVYIFLTSAVLLLVPLFLLAEQKCGRAGLALTLFLIGASCSLFDYLRSHSATAVILFIVSWMALSPRWARNAKMLALAALLLGTVLPQLYFQQLLAKRETFLSERDPQYDGGYAGHAFWHVVYVGMGFVPNQYVPAALDEVSANKAAGLEPGASYLSRRYEQVMKSATLSLVREHPLVLFVNLYVKAVLIAVIICLFGNFGLWAAWAYPKPPAQQWPFWIGITFESIFGFVSHPHPQYLLGMGVFTALYAIHSIAVMVGKQRPEPG